MVAGVRVVGPVEVDAGEARLVVAGVRVVGPVEAGAGEVGPEVLVVAWPEGCWA
ncbi:hypothetical protein [Streptomyces sp. NPDC056480]|uniref:hypothetical protein n=1 Tax=Streptomyces sp. NPDC056480 TaxID=3345833 RepID=UPI00367AF08B